jgi:hypothetical protein
VQQRPGKEHRNKDNNRTAKQQDQQVSQLSPGLTLYLPRPQEPKHRERQTSVSRLRKQMGNYRPDDRKPPQQEYPFCETHIILFRFDK